MPDQERNRASRILAVQFWVPETMVGSVFGKVYPGPWNTDRDSPKKTDDKERWGHFFS